MPAITIGASKASATALPVAIDAGSGHSTLETASSIFGIIGGAAGLIALITVVVAICPIWADLQNLESAEKENYLGGWRDLVKSRDGLFLRTLAIVPAVSLYLGLSATRSGCARRRCWP